MRTFIAFEIPAPLKRTIGSFQGKLKKDFASLVSWVPEENFHITVWFLGEQDLGVIQAVEPKLKEALKDEAPFEVRIGSLAWMPSRRPRVIYLELHDTGGLQRVATKAKEALWETVSPSIFERPFLAHVTLGRVKQPQATIEERFKRLDGLASPQDSFWVRGLTVFESRLSPKGSSYRPLSFVPFGERTRNAHS